MPKLEDYTVEISTRITIRTFKGRIIEEFTVTDEGKATSDSSGIGLRDRVDLLSAWVYNRLMKHVAATEENEKTRLS